MRADLGSLNFIRLLRVGSCIIPSVRGENDAEQSDEVQPRIRENAKYLDWKQDLTATLEAGFTKIWRGMREFFFACLSGIRAIVRTSGTWESTTEARAVVSLVLCRLPVCFFHFFSSSSSYRGMKDCFVFAVALILILII